jgi:hypothetical protein
MHPQTEPILENCTCEGIKMYGKVRIVDQISLADFKVKIVESFPDLKVRLVKNFADSCGKWKIVDSFEDFRIIFVDAHEDFRIKFVDAFEGLP